MDSHQGVNPVSGEIGNRDHPRSVRETPLKAH
jgi:hypothetical protein